MYKFDLINNTDDLRFVTNIIDVINTDYTKNEIELLKKSWELIKYLAKYTDYESFNKLITIINNK